MLDLVPIVAVVDNLTAVVEAEQSRAGQGQPLLG